METDLTDKLAAFSLSKLEDLAVKLDTTDVSIGYKEGSRSLIGKVFGDKRANFLGVKNSLMKLWHHRGLKRVVGLEQNTFQFVFNSPAAMEGILHSRPWFFDNQILVLHPWSAQLRSSDPSFSTSPIWIQVWHISPHWISIETGRKIGQLRGNTLNVLIADGGPRKEDMLKF